MYPGASEEPKETGEETEDKSQKRQEQLHRDSISLCITLLYKKKEES